MDIHGEDLSNIRSHSGISEAAKDGNIYRFLEQPGFNETLLKTMIEGATELAEESAKELKLKSADSAQNTLQAALKRLVNLRKINDHVRLEEIEDARGQLEHASDAIAQARLRLDSIRLIVEGEIEALVM